MASPNTLVLSAKQLTALQKHDRQQSNLVRIKDANQNCYESRHKISDSEADGCSDFCLTPWEGGGMAQKIAWPTDR